MQRMIFVLFLSALLIAHIITLENAAREQDGLPRGEEILLSLPSPLLKISCLEYSGVVSDFMLLRALVFIGKHIEKQETLQLKKSEWEEFAAILQAISYLDPYFSDPYYIGNAYLTWYAGMAREANSLLERGKLFREWDWVPPFFIGFNYFYFLQDYDKAAEFLMTASRRPDASPILASLASRLAFKANRTENSIAFLEEMIRKTDDESMKKAFETRVKAFKAILVLEQAVDVYRNRFRRVPANLDELVKKNILIEIPKDPYGGQFSVDSQGAIKTTSESLLMPYQRP